MSSLGKGHRRAAHACLKCRRRKIRCDVSLCGLPCTNCHLDGEECEVSSRRRRQRHPWDSKMLERPIRHDRAASRQSRPVDTPRTSRGVDKASPRNQYTSAEQALETDMAGVTAAESVKDSQLNTLSTTSPRRDSMRDSVHDSLVSAPVLDDVEYQQSSIDLTQADCNDSFEKEHHGNLNLSTREIPSVFPTSHEESIAGFWKQRSMPNHSSYVPFSYFSFLTLSNLSLLATQDVQFLEVQGCLRVPCRSILTKFMRQYFLHVHPILPMLNEGDFWDMYFQAPDARLPGQRVSLLLFMSMLFACCNFISPETIDALGISMHEARPTFYRRAKLLFDLEAESSSIATSQAALLLSSWGITSGGLTRKPHIPWLSIAIQHAKDAKADRYETDLNGIEEQATLKRLWWCCIIRDHMFSLNMRRSIQITRRHFDFEQSPILSSADMADEKHRSMVYEPEIKVQLARMLELLVELCILLTEALECVFPVEDRFNTGEPHLEAKPRIDCCKTALERWHKEARARFPQFGQASANGQNGQHESVILFTVLLKMYYYSSKIVLSHYQLIRFATISTNSMLDDFVLKDNRLELQTAVLGTTGCLEKLLKLRLARWLPVSAIVCTALPLLLNIIDVEILSPPLSHDTKHLKLKRHCIRILSQAMDVYKQHYEGVDWVSDTIQYIVGLVRIERTAAPRQPQSPKHIQRGADADDCLEILMSKPSWYLGVAFAFDVSLSTGRLPTDQVLVKALRTLLSGDTDLNEDSDMERESSHNYICFDGAVATQVSEGGETTTRSCGCEGVDSYWHNTSATVMNEDVAVTEYEFSPVPVLRESGSSTLQPSNWFEDNTMAGLENGAFGEGGGIFADDLKLLSLCI